MAKLADIARRAKGGDRQAQAQLAALKKMAAGRAHPGRVSGDSLGPYDGQDHRIDALIGGDLGPYDGQDHRIDALIGCPPSVGDDARDLIVGLGFPNMAHAVRRAQQGDQRARAAVQKVMSMAKQGNVAKMRRRARLAKLCARFASGQVGMSPLPEPPSEASILFNGEVVGPPMIGCPPAPVGVNPLTVGLIPSPMVGCPPLPRV